MNEELIERLATRIVAALRDGHCSFEIADGSLDDTVRAGTVASMIRAELNNAKVTSEVVATGEMEMVVDGHVSEVKVPRIALSQLED